jgi:putative NADH-flavin reductase
MFKRQSQQLRIRVAACIASTALLLAAMIGVDAQPPGSSAAPLRIAVYGASGRVGSRIVAEALARGHFVTGIGRRVDSIYTEHQRLTTVTGDVTDPESVAATVVDHDAVISAISGNNPDSDDPNDSIPMQAARALVAGLRSLGTNAPRVIVVGGGSTTLEERPGVRFDDPNDIPEGPRGVRMLGHGLALDYFGTVTDVRWTFFSPALQMRPGERTGVFRVGGSVVITDGNGDSAISMEDFAVAMIDELEMPEHINEQMTVAY